MRKPRQRSPTAGPTVRSLVAEKYLPRAARERWSRDRVFFQIAELNALVDPLLVRQPPAARAQRLAGARARAQAVRTAARWVPEASVAGAWAYLDSEAAAPEDAFGPALLLEALAPEDPRTRELLARLPRAVRRLLAELA
jgi:hypothetical protein